MEALVASLRAEILRKDQLIAELTSQLDKYQAVFLNNGLGATGATSGASGATGGTGPAKRTTRLLGISAEPAVDGRSPQQQQAPPILTPKDDRTHTLLATAFGANDFLKQVLEQDCDQVREMAEACVLQRFRNGAVVVKEGDPGHVLYVLESGSVRVTTAKGTVSRVLARGALFGELALLYNCTRTATVTVIEGDSNNEAVLWALERSAFQWLMVQSGLRRRQQLLTFLRNVPLFSQFSQHHQLAPGGEQSASGANEQLLAKVADACERRTYELGEYIVRQGARGDTFFVLAKGRVQVSEGTGPDERPLRQLEPGAYFGEKALGPVDASAGDGGADFGVRTANVVALEQAQCLVLDRESFRQLIGPQLTSWSSQQQPSTTTIAEESVARYSWLQLNQLQRLKTLGVGGFGRVDLVVVKDRPNEGSFALKVMQKRQIVETRQQQHIISEKQVMLRCVDSPFVVRLWRTFKDSQRLYLLMESCLGGELWTLLRDRGHFDEAAARFYTGCVCAAFQFLHQRNIVYRDLKPENMLLDSRGYVKLTDFGFAKQLPGNGRKTWTFCGTPEYVAPEIILNRGHDLAADFWSLGVLLFELLTGSPPFTGPDPMHTYNIILKGIEGVEFPRLISRNAAALIRRLCRENPTERLGYATGNGIDDVKAHRWFDGFDWSGLATRQSPAPYVPIIGGPTDASNFDDYPDETAVGAAVSDKTDVPAGFVTDLGGWDDDF